MKQYRDLLQKVLDEGEERETRNAVTRSLFGQHCEFDCRDGFPIVTSREIHFRSIVGELLWFLRGQTNIKYLLDEGINIWNKNAYANYVNKHMNFETVSYEQYIYIGKSLSLDALWSSGLFKWYKCDNIYGKFWAEQLPILWQNLKYHPYDRRHIVQVPILANSVETVGDNQCLPPCHILWQLYVSKDGFIDIHVYQRSADIFLGVPFNISSYALLLHIIANELNLVARKVIFSYGDLHLYQQHYEQAIELLSKPTFPLPQLTIREYDSGDNEFGDRGDCYTSIRNGHPLGSYKIDDFKLVGYESGAKIKAIMVV